MSNLITMDEFLRAAKEFILTSDRICDEWSLKVYKGDPYKTFIKKELFFEHIDNNKNVLLKIEYIIFYNMSYGVPSFSFNIWDSSGALLSLEDVRKMSFIRISQKNFYSVVTQQEHPIFQRPYFIVHPCHTEVLLSAFRNNSKNIIVTFLGFVTPLVKLDLPYEYGI